MIVADPIFREHKTGPGHPESPERYDRIAHVLRGLGQFIKPKKATREQILYCHTEKYFNLVKKEVEKANQEGLSTLSTGDVQISPISFEAALYAVGAVITAVDLEEKVFCLVRPPGHHACSNRGMGFCLFNNVSIGARYAQQKYGYKRILIVDWDVHHGNGTQEIFEKDPSIFYFSTHQANHYPGTGAVEEKGLGNILNIPINPGRESRFEVVRAFQEVLVERMKDFKPQLIFISAGFDGHVADPLGGFNLEDKDFGTLTEIMKNLANRYTGGKMISVLEGGYHLRALASAVKTHFISLIS